MFKSFLRAMSVSMLIIGTMIGAGFASGKEVVSFFGDVPNVFIALIAGGLVFACSVLFLFVGRRVKKTDIGEVNGAVFGKLRPFADVFMLFNSMTVLGAMLAGTDSLAAEFIDIRPLASIVLGLLCAVTAVKGLSGVIKANAVLVPVMIVFLCACSICAMEFPFRPQSSNISVYSIVLYVSMNMILGGGVLTTVHKLSPREIILAAAVAATVIAALLLCIMGALQFGGARGYADTANCVEKREGDVFCVHARYCRVDIHDGAVRVQVRLRLCQCVFQAQNNSRRHRACRRTDCRCVRVFQRRRHALSDNRNNRFVVFGLQLLVPYPYSRKTQGKEQGEARKVKTQTSVYVIAFFRKTFHARNSKIHNRCEYAQYDRACHYQIHFKYLTAVNYEIAQARRRHKVFAHDCADPSKSDVYFEHVDERGHVCGYDEFGKDLKARRAHGAQQ